MRSKKVIALLLTVSALAGLLGGCGNKIDENATFATLNDTTISMGVANFCAKYEQAMYDSFYMSYFGENMWESDLYGSGSTMTEDVKSDIAEGLQDMYLLKAHMEEYGVSLTADEEAAIAAAADEFIAANSKAAIKQVGAENKENVLEMLRLNTIQKKMYDRIIQDAKAEVSDEEAAQRTYSYVLIDTSGHYDEESNLIEYTDEEKADLLAKAEGIAAAEDFDAAVTDAGYTVSTASYGSAADENATTDVAVLEAADALKEGQISNVIETANGYYVIRLDKEFDEEATAAKKEEIITQKQDDYYNDILSGWRDAATWTINEEEWAKVTFEDHFTAPAAEESTEAAAEEVVVEDTES